MAEAPSSSAAGRPRLSGRAVGALIGAIFGFIFVEANSAELPVSWQAVARIGGVLVFVALLAGIGRERRAQAAAQTASSPPAFSRGYWTIVAAELVALLAGVIVINVVIGAHALTVPWIALIVGVHFFGLGALWKAGIYHLLGAALAVLGIAGFVLHLAGASDAVVALVSGIGSGVALDLATGSSVYSSIATFGKR